MLWDTKADFDKFYQNYPERWGHPGSRPGIVLGYHWAPIISAQAGISWGGTKSPDFPQLIFDLLGLSAGDALVLMGAGFNGTGAGLEALGVHVIGTDTSAYILNEKGNTEEAELRAAIIAAGLDPDVDTIRGPAGDVNPLDLLMEGGRASPAVRGKGEILDQDLSTNGSVKAVLRRFDQLWPGITPRYILTEEVLNSITDAQAALVCDYASAAATDWGATVVHMLSPLQAGSTQAPELNWKTYQGWRTWLDSNGYSGHLILPTVSATGQGVTLPAGGEPGTVVMYSGLI